MLLTCALLLSSLPNESWFLCFLRDIISLVKEIVSLLGFSENLFLWNMVDNAVIILVPSFLIMVHISNVMARVSIQCPTNMNHKSLKLIWFVINQNMERSLNIFSVFFKVRSLFNESHQLEQDYFVLRNDINCFFKILLYIAISALNLVAVGKELAFLICFKWFHNTVSNL